MSKVKKIIVGVLVTALITGAAGGGLIYMRNSNQKEVLVASVGSLASDYYSPSTTLDGNVTTSVSQNITVDKDMIIEEVYVQKGDTVKKGDKLISFDMTLVEMELNIAKLKHQKLEQDLRKAQQRLSSLQNGGPVTEDDAEGTADNLGGYDSSDDSSDDLELSSATGKGDYYLAAIMKPLLLSAATADFGDAEQTGAGNGETVQDEAGTAAYGEAGAAFDEAGGEDSGMAESGAAPEQGSVGGDSALDYYDKPDNGFGDGSSSSDNSGFGSGGGEPLAPEPTPTPEPIPGFEFADLDEKEGDSDFTDGEEPFYQILEFDTEPFAGSGTKDDPFIYLCTSAKGYVSATGAFLNKMAGYNADGTQVIQEGGYWYQLEFHQYDTISDYTDRKKSCTGYYLIDGSMLSQPVDRFAEMDFTLDGASQYEEDEIPDDDPDIPIDGGSGLNLSRAEAIKIQQKRIATLKLDIQESDINITKLEKKVSRQLITSKLDGTVSTVGDPVTGTNSDGNAFMTIKSGDGFFIRGTVSELMLDQMKEGTVLKCTCYSYYEDGAKEFEAEIMEVSDYPVSSSSGGYYYGDGNPNVSSYSYTATIPDKSVKVQDGDYVSIMLADEVSASGIVLSKAFVRTEDGNSYVYKDDNGVLKKQMVSVGGNVDGGYSVLVTGGITREDKIAFPYSKSTKEGMKTKEGSLEEFYGY